mmetsp:Transcript_35023/g.96825  ORF Transcript_35023/g.96825 Transcript_35023/m.96825 type:complete len:238 (-) Transcript_35023:2067-2780(-)
MEALQLIRVLGELLRELQAPPVVNPRQLWVVERPRFGEAALTPTVCPELLKLRELSRACWGYTQPLRRLCCRGSLVALLAEGPALAMAAATWPAAQTLAAPALLLPVQLSAAGAQRAIGLGHGPPSGPAAAPSLSDYHALAFAAEADIKGFALATQALPRPVGATRTKPCSSPLGVLQQRRDSLRQVPGEPLHSCKTQQRWAHGAHDALPLEPICTQQKLSLRCSQGLQCKMDSGPV